MKKLIDELNDEHVYIDNFMCKLELAVAGTHFLNNLLEMEGEFISFANKHLLDHHAKEEKFLYHWMVEQNKNSDKELIRKMIDDHKNFEESAKWIISEMAHAKKGEYQNHANLGFKISEFLKNYQEHLNRESHFIFLIAEGLEQKDAHQ